MNCTMTKVKSLVSENSSTFLRYTALQFLGFAFESIGDFGFFSVSECDEVVQLIVGCLVCEGKGWWSEQQYEMQGCYTANSPM